MKHIMHSKTVQSEEEHGLISKFKGIFKKKIKEKPVKIKKNGEQRKKYCHATEIQVRKIFRLKKDNPKLSNIDVGKAVGISEVLVRYYLLKGKTESMKNFKKKQKRLESPKKVKKEIPKVIRSLKPEPKEPDWSKTSKVFKDAERQLNELFKTEKYPVEHQADPRYFKEALPPQAVATVEAFKGQKRKNNINRAVVAKKINKDKEITKEQNELEATKSRLRKKHQDKTPKIHYDTCPSCNENSPYSLEAYQHLVKKESWRRKEYADQQLKLHEKEKELDQTKRNLELTVAERTQQGTKLCIICDIRLSYGQATRSQNIFGVNYCSDHEP